MHDSHGALAGGKVSADVSYYCFEAREGIAKAHGPGQSLYSDVCSTLSMNTLLPTPLLPRLRTVGSPVPRGLSRVRPQGLHWLSQLPQAWLPELPGSQSPSDPSPAWPSPPREGFRHWWQSRAWAE